jgi:hypothetical protein
MPFHRMAGVLDRSGAAIPQKPARGGSDIHLQAVTADYQLISKPAYNADRGPVSIASGRGHGEF